MKPDKCWMLYFDANHEHCDGTNKWVVGCFPDNEYRSGECFDGYCDNDSAHDTLDRAVERLRELSGEVPRW
jgi:hypothetical protein